jgi:hypothetical protein
MLVRVFRRLNTAMQFLTLVVISLIGGLLLDCALLASAALLFGVRKFSWINPLSWAVPLHWNWDTIWKAAVIGLLIWIVILLRRNRFGQTLVVVIPTSSRPRSNLHGLTMGAFDTEPASRQPLVHKLKNSSPYDLAKNPGFDPMAHPDLASMLVNSGALVYMTASQRDATIKAAGLSHPDNN